MPHVKSVRKLLPISFLPMIGALLTESSSMNSTEYKTFHESFMQNNHGSTPLHTFLCIFFTVQSVIFNAIQSQKSGLLQYVTEYFIIVLPITFGHTVLSDYIYLLNAILFTLLLYELVKSYSKLEITKIINSKNVFTSRVKTITCIRSMMYIVTVFCILAVDFKAFPRYLAKTETYGISFMDMGVGLFMIMSGLVHKDLRNFSLSRILKSNAKFIAILLVLGIVRTISVKKLDYHEHISEYGVHWNFFFTLAICKVVSTVLLSLSNRALLLSILTIISHEVLLDFGLKDWVFGDTKRTNFLNANKEGVSSILGYVSLYIFGAFIKNTLTKIEITRGKVLTKFLAIILILFIILSIPNTVGKTCRVLANSAYCMYACMFMLLAITPIYIFECIYHKTDGKLMFEVPKILSAVNNNGLTFFLVANLLTGAINLSIKTLFVSNTVAIAVLNVYMIVTLSLAVWLEKVGVRI